MRKSLHTAFIVIALALTFAVMAISLPAFSAAGNVKLGASSSIAFATFANQQSELNNAGLKLEMINGKPTLQETTNTGDALTTERMGQRHEDLIKQGILRYVMYNGSLCQQSQEGLQLIVILDFSNYNVSVFESGFLKGLTYVILGSKQVNLFGSGVGSKFEEFNTDGGALTLYDSADGGSVVNKPARLTLQGFGSDGSTYIEEISGGQYINKQAINRYSIRIILPGNLKEPVTLKTGSLTLKGVSSLGGIFSPKQPDCIGLGISHMGITKDHSATIVKEDGAADSSHFHWLTVTGLQMEYALKSSLDKILNVSGATNVEVGYTDEIFIKPQAHSDFAHLYMQCKKTDSGTVLNLYDSPMGELVESADGMTAAVRLFYWMEYIYKPHYRDVTGSATLDALSYNHYRRSAINEIENIPGVLSYDSTATVEIDGELCHTVYCSHFMEASGIIGYFSASGKVFNADKVAVELK